MNEWLVKVNKEKMGKDENMLEKKKEKQNEWEIFKKEKWIEDNTCYKHGVKKM